MTQEQQAILKLQLENDQLWQDNFNLKKANRELAAMVSEAGNNAKTQTAYSILKREVASPRQ